MEESSVIFNNGHLSYIGQDCEVIPADLVSYGESVRRLDLSFNNLTNLDRLNGFPNLEELILDNNCLSDAIEFPDIVNLHTLMINKNNIKDLDKLLEQICVHMPRVKYLSLLGNEACPNELSSLQKDEDDYRRYRLYVLFKLPNLKFLDSSPVKESERQEAQRQGKYLRVVKPDPNDTVLKGSMSKKTKDSNSSPYSPLPDTLREEPDHKATFGKSRYMYYGKHSEGNRFIRNNDL